MSEVRTIKKRNISKRKKGNPVSKAAKKVSDGFYRSVSTSATGRALLNYEGEEKAMKKSFFYTLFRKLVRKTDPKKLKYNIQRNVESSKMMYLFKKFIDVMLTALIRQYGVFVFSLGIYTLVIYFLGIYTVDSLNVTITHLIAGITELLCSLPMLVSKKSLTEALKESRMANLVFFRILGLSPEMLERKREKSQTAGSIPFVLGIIAGLATTFISPVTMLIFFAVLLCMYIALISPESGLLMVIFSLPYMSENMLRTAVLYLILCYALKAVRGKRVFRFELTDYAVLALAFVFLLGSFNSVSGSESFGYTGTFITYICAYFLIVNTIKTKPWIRRVVFSLVFTVVVSAMTGMLQRFVSDADFILAEGIVNNGTVRAAFSSPEILAQFIILFGFYLFAYFISSKSGFVRKLFIFMLCAVVTACIFFTMTPLLTACFVMALLFFFLLYSRKSFFLLVVLGIAAPFGAYLLPDVIMSRINDYFILAKEELILRAEALNSSLAMASDHIFSGCGTGSYGALYSRYSTEATDAAATVYNTYFQTLIEVGMIGLIVLVCIIYLFFKCNFSMYAKRGAGLQNIYSVAGVSGMVGILLAGFCENIWQNSHLVLAFWIAFGLCMAIKRYSVFEQKGYEEYLLGNK